MLPNYTEAKIGILTEQQETIKANRYANEIIKNNKHVSIAYNIKALNELENENYSKVCEYKEKAIELNKYSSKEYEDYIILLSKILDKTVRNGDGENTLKYINKVLEIPNMVEQVENNTTSLAKKIRDSSKIELNDQTLQYINNMKGMVNNENVK